jgi:hypothetical protein
MPNWVTNRVSISGKHADVDAALAKLVNAEGAVDFNIAVPMPDTLDIPSGTETDVGLWLIGGEDKYGHSSRHAHDFANIPFRKTEEERADALVDLLLERPARSQADMTAALNEVNGPSKTRAELLELLKDHDCVKHARMYVENVKLYGCGDWYDWCCRYWGTKWNACSSKPVYITAVTKNTRRANVIFDTAWCSPDPVLRAIVAAVPGVVIKNRWRDEGGPNGTDVFEAPFTEELAEPRPVGAQPITGTIFEAMATAHVTEDELVDELRKAAGA